jgi:hypothetical protein
MNRFLSIATVLVVGLAGASAAQAGDDFLKFDGAIGVDPVAGQTAGVPVVNAIFDAQPGGRPWILRKFKATIGADGRVTAKGSGLLLSAGTTIGTRGAVTQVALSLYCNGVATPNSTQPVALDLAGNFSVKGGLASTPPNPCNTPVLLVRNATNGTPGAWFAAGIVDSDD